jgi:peptidyl-prolyl cis-trans isomerase D
VAQFSDGPKEEGGKLELTPGNPNIPEAINNFAFDHKKGDVGVVKSEYGYSILRITDQKDFQTGYKIAYLSRHLDPSQETDNAAFSAASQFAGNNRTSAAFEKATQGDKGVIRHVAENIAPDAYEVQGIGSARDLIQWAFKAKVGDVSDVFSLGNHNVVALLTASKEKGIAQLADVRPQIEALVRRDEKAKQIAAKMKGSSLGELASALKDTVSEAQHIGFSTPFIPNAGFEPKVVGAAFNTDLKGGKLSSPVYGNNGVYVLKVDSVSQEPTPAAESEQDLRQEQMMLRQQVGSQVIDVLKKEADIEDHRLKFF